MNNYEMLSFCGIYCGACVNFKRNLNCAGCRNEPSLVSDCPTRDCTIERGLLHCGECADFPCSVLDAFYNDGKPMHLAAYHNMLEIIKDGADLWLEKQAQMIESTE